MTRALYTGIFCLFTFACSTPIDSASGCERDAECANSEFCEVETGLCLCADDNACDATEFCNDLGRCQARQGCVDNGDCGAATNEICDTTSGECISLSASTLQCTLSSHCPFGTICQGNLCVTGCEENGDCPLGQPCLNSQCDATPGACNESSYCEFGQICNLQSNGCLNHRERNDLCALCDARSVLGGCANQGPCLIDGSVPPDNCTTDEECNAISPGAYCFASGDPNNSPQCNDDSECANGQACEKPFGNFLPGYCSAKQCIRTFCGSSDCSDADPCPRGYGCVLISVVSGEACTLANDTCQGGRACSAGGENAGTGFCSCINDGDCPGLTTCVNPGPTGRCIQSSSCAPASGLRCEDLR